MPSFFSDDSFLEARKKIKSPIPDLRLECAQETFAALKEEWPTAGPEEFDLKNAALLLLLDDWWHAQDTAQEAAFAIECVTALRTDRDFYRNIFQDSLGHMDEILLYYSKTRKKNDGWQDVKNDAGKALYKVMIHDLAYAGHEDVQKKLEKMERYLPGVEQICAKENKPVLAELGKRYTQQKLQANK